MLAAILIRQTLSALTDGRVVPHPMPENMAKTLPYITYQKISGSALQTLDEYTGEDRVRVQVNVYHSTVIDVEQLGIAVKKALVNQPHSAVEISGERSEHDTETNTDSVQIDFMIWQNGCN